MLIRTDITAYQLQPLSNIIRVEDGETSGIGERERLRRGTEERVATSKAKEEQN